MFHVARNHVIKKSGVSIFNFYNSKQNNVKQIERGNNISFTVPNKAELSVTLLLHNKINITHFFLYLYILCFTRFILYVIEICEFPFGGCRKIAPCLSALSIDNIKSKRKGWTKIFTSNEMFPLLFYSNRYPLPYATMGYFGLALLKWNVCFWTSTVVAKSLVILPILRWQ